MSFNNIKINFINKKNNNIKNSDDIVPLISDVHKNTNVLNSINLKQNKSKNTFFYIYGSLSSKKEKLIYLYLTILGKNLNSPLCKYRKIILNDIKTDQNPYKLIFKHFHLYGIFNFNFNNKAKIYCLFDYIYKYLWTIDYIKSKLQHKKINNTKLYIVYNFFGFPFIKLLHFVNPNAKIILRFHDMIGPRTAKKIYKLKKLSYCKCETYSLLDSTKFRIDYWPNSVNFTKMKQLYNPSPKYDFYFLGNIDGERLQFLYKLSEYLKYHKLSFLLDAIIFNKNDSSISPLISKIKQNQLIRINTTPITYIKYLRNLANSKAIIDFFRLSSDEGLSFRTAEALALKKKIITNRDLNANNLYKFKENILSFDDIDKVDLREFIDKPYVGPDPELLKQFDINEQIKNYLKN